jgi:hypothetical protein
MALAFRVLKNAGVAPPWIEANKEAGELLAKRDAILERAASGTRPSVFARKRGRETLTDLVARVNKAIAKVNAEAPPSTVRRPLLDLEQELERYESACRR